jgi:NADH-dependent peroxiredoxin subunit F
MRDVIVLGAGPAGLAAANYLLRKRLDILVVSEDLGGKSAQSIAIPEALGIRVIRPTAIIENFRKSIEYLTHLHQLGHAETVNHRDDGFSIAFRDESGKRKRETSRAVIVATGTTPRYLGVPGESEFAGRGLGYSSISYSHLLIGKKVFLVGDSQRTVDDALELAIQAREVVILFEEGSRYREIFQEQLASIENVTVLDAERVTAFEGDDFARRAVVTSRQGKPMVIEADAFFVQLQPEPNSRLVKELVSTDEEDRIVVDMRNRTTLPGLLAAGDVTNVGFEQILVALGEGSKAALTAYQYLTRR